jgi:hypothetical protein
MKKYLLGRPRHRCEYIKMYLKKIGCETADRIQLDHTEQQEIAQEGLGQLTLTTITHTCETPSDLPS